MSKPRRVASAKGVARYKVPIGTPLGGDSVSRLGRRTAKARLSIMQTAGKLDADGGAPSRRSTFQNAPHQQKAKMRTAAARRGDNSEQRIRMQVRSEIAFADKKMAEIDIVDNQPEPSSEARAVARNQQGAAAREEPKITNNVVSAMLRNRARPERLGFRLKTEKSFALKIDRDVAESVEDGRPVSHEDAGSNIKDLVRFTATTPTATYWESGDAILQDLIDKGDTVVKDNKNAGRSWGRRTYRGRNVQMRDSSGVFYELQIHTPESLKVAETNHTHYNEWRHQDTSAARKSELDKIMGDLFESIPVPPGTRLTESR